MDIKKLGLAYTIAVLSITVALGGCDLLKSEESINEDKARAVMHEARAKFYKTMAAHNKAKDEFGRNSAEWKKAYDEFEKAYAKLDKASRAHDRAYSQYRNSSWW